MIPDVPPAVAAKARLAGSHAWLAALPALVADLEAEWGFTAGRAYRGGTEAYVAEAVLAGGEPAVLKLIVPRLGNDPAHEIATLLLAGGDGCARLLRHDTSRAALLLERLGPSLADLRVPILHRHRILAGLAAAVWRPAAGHGLPTGADKGRWLAAMVARSWEDLDRPCAERTVEHALACVTRRVAAHDDERAVLVHGDVHQWNALSAGDGFKLVDPDGLLAEAEYDLGVMMREDPAELMAGDPWERAHWLAARTGTDATAIWEWGVTERVSTGLVLLSIGMAREAREMLAVADRIALQAS